MKLIDGKKRSILVDYIDLSGINKKTHAEIGQCGSCINFKNSTCMYYHEHVLSDDYCDGNYMFNGVQEPSKSDEMKLTLKIRM